MGVTYKNELLKCINTNRVQFLARSFLVDLVHASELLSIIYWVDVFLLNETMADKPNLCFGWNGDLVNNIRQKKEYTALTILTKK